MWSFKGIEVDGERVMQRTGAVTEARRLVCDAVRGGRIKFANLHRPTNPCHEPLSVTHV